MKIINLTEFLTMPAGTVFAKYQPCVLEPFCIKGENRGEIDFYYTNLGHADFQMEIFESAEQGTPSSDRL